MDEKDFKPEPCPRCGNKKGNKKIRDFNGVWILDECGKCGVPY